MLIQKNERAEDECLHRLFRSNMQEKEKKTQVGKNILEVYHGNIQCVRML